MHMGQASNYATWAEGWRGLGKEGSLHFPTPNPNPNPDPNPNPNPIPNPNPNPNPDPNPNLTLTLTLPRRAPSTSPTASTCVKARQSARSGRHHRL